MKTRAYSLWMLLFCCLWLNGSQALWAQTKAAYRFPPNQQRTYQFTLETDQKLYLTRILKMMQESDPSVKPSNQAHDQRYQMTLKGAMRIYLVEKKGSNSVLAYQFNLSDVQLNVDAQPMSESDRQAFKGMLNQCEFFVEMGPEGQILRTWQAMTQEIFVINTLRGLISATQCVLPKASTSPWQANEDAPEGRYRARYEVRSKDKEYWKIAKTRLAYTELTDTGMGQKITAQPSGAQQFVFNLKSGAIQSVSGAWNQKNLMRKTVVGEGSAQLQMRLQKTEPLDPALISATRTKYQAWAKIYKPARLFGAISNPEQDAIAQHRIALAGETYDSLLKATQTLPDDADITPLTDFYLKWRALFYLQPATCARAKQYVLKQPPLSSRARLIAIALQGAGTPEAQRALIDLMWEHRKNSDAYSFLVPLTCGVQEPTQELENALKKLTAERDPDVANPARLGLGQATEHILKSAPARGNALVDWMIQSLKRASSNNDRVSWLMALGNAGSARAQSSILPYARHSSPNMRYAAITALRKISTPEAEAALVYALLNEQEMQVRNEAADGLGMRKMSAKSFQAHKQAMTKEQSPTLRITIMTNLWQARQAYPEAKTIVQRALRSDESEDVRKAAQKLLNGS